MKKVEERTNVPKGVQTRVSVIMPCYNDGKYIMEAIDSVRKQTWENVEIIIVDDGSDDTDTVQVLKSVENSGITLIQGGHRGPAAARNLGIKKATGEYILPLDADDTIEKDYIEKAAVILDESQNVGIVYCHADLFGERDGKWEIPEYSLRAELVDNCIFVSSLFRKTQWEQVGGFCEKFKAGMEDYDFWLSIIGLGYEVVQLEEVLFHYRIKETSRTTNFKDNYQAVQETYVDLYERHKGLIKDNIDIYCKELRRFLIDYIYYYQENEKINQNPVINYWRSVLELKPDRVKRFERWLQYKDRIKKVLRK